MVIIHAGAISGPYAQRNATMAVYRWKASARADVERVLALLWPFLGTIKHGQAQRLLETTTLSIDRLAGEVGFGSSAVLREHFAEVLGTSPLAYRRAFTAA